MSDDKELALFNAKVLIAIASKDTDKLASVIEKEILADGGEACFSVYMEALAQLGELQGAPLPEDPIDTVKMAASFGENLREQIKDPAMALGLAASAATLLPTLAYGASWLGGKVKEKFQINRMIKEDPLLKQNPKEAKQYYNMIVTYAPALKKAPLVINNIIKSWISTGPEYITHAHMDQLLSLQDKANKSSTLDQIDKATRIVSSVAAPAREISGIMRDNKRMKHDDEQSAISRRHDLSRDTAQRDYNRGKEKRDRDRSLALARYKNMTDAKRLKKEEDIKALNNKVERLQDALYAAQTNQRGTKP